jgi:hypothetical protein
MVIIDVGTNPGISNRVPALGGGPFAQSSLINDFGFSRVAILGSYFGSLSIISLIICNSLILRRPLSSLLYKIFPRNYFLLLEVIISHILKGWK